MYMYVYMPDDNMEFARSLGCRVHDKKKPSRRVTISATSTCATLFYVGGIYSEGVRGRHMVGQDSMEDQQRHPKPQLCLLDPLLAFANLEQRNMEALLWSGGSSIGCTVLRNFFNLYYGKTLRK